MSLNWVMLARSPADVYVPLEGETTVFRAAARSAFRLKSIAKLPSSSSTFPGNAAAVSAAQSLPRFESSRGQLLITSQRLIYVPDSHTHGLGPAPGFASFAAPLRNIYDAHVTQPWFGPNAWMAVVIPVPDGGLPERVPFELTITFNEGGAFEFHEAFERIRERVQEGLNHIEQLPVYTATASARSRAPQPHTAQAVPVSAVDDDAPPPSYSAVADTL
ncbi:uncharacterized protein V1518DRAFT_305952 [Limtongia smithiae]|uniref:uncharacterized protein n=1 Tax=Limtongia smithiae TaxID=1125753 RepID=UPI0034CE0334